MPQESMDFPIVPIADIHIHPQTIGWTEVESLGMSNYRAMLEVATNYHWVAHIPVPPDEVKFLWNYALYWAKYAEKTHGIRTKVQIAVHTLAKVMETDSLLKYMPQFIKENSQLVRAIGETGFEPTQYGGVGLPYEEQEKLLRAQVSIASEANIPIIFHTPVQKTVAQGAWDPNLALQRTNWPDAKIEATTKDIELAKDIGISENHVVIDHVDSSTADLVLSKTKMYCAFSVAFLWRNVGADTVAKYIKKYGDDRIIVDSDIAGNAYYELLALPRVARNLTRLGIPKESVRKVAFDNPLKIIGLDPKEVAIPA